LLHLINAISIKIEKFLIRELLRGEILPYKNKGSKDIDITIKAIEFNTKSILSIIQKNALDST